MCCTNVKENKSKDNPRVIIKHHKNEMNDKMWNMCVRHCFIVTQIQNLKDTQSVLPVTFLHKTNTRSFFAIDIRRSKQKNLNYKAFCSAELKYINNVETMIQKGTVGRK